MDLAQVKRTSDGIHAAAQRMAHRATVTPAGFIGLNQEEQRALLPGLTCNWSMRSALQFR